MEAATPTRPVLELVWTLWQRRKWWAVVTFAAFFAAVVTLIQSLPDLYRAVATVLVTPDEVPENFVRPSVTGEVESRLQTIKQALLSRARLQELIDRFDLYPELGTQAGPETVIKRMREDIGLESSGVQDPWGRGTTIAFTLSYQSWDPGIAADVTNTLAELYVEENENVRERQASGTAAFLKQQLREVRQELQDQERRVAVFKHRFSAELPEQQSANLATLERFNSQLQLNNENQIRLLERREKLVDILADSGVLGVDDTAEGIAARIERAYRELTELQARFSEKYPDVVRVKAEIEALRARQKEIGSGRRSPARTPSGGLRQIDGQLAALRNEEQRLRDEIAAYQERVENAPQREQELSRLMHDYDTVAEHYASLMKRYEDARLAATLEREKSKQFRILDPAIPPSQPVAPNRGRLLLMGFVLSLLMAAGAVLLAEQSDSSFHSLTELRHFTKVPVVASIPIIVTSEDSRRRWLGRCVAAAAVALGLTLIIQLASLIGSGNEQIVWALAGRGA
jgi:polysaccharide chain length determinant protein (PEP-CTERM system associated)